MVVEKSQHRSALLAVCIVGAVIFLGVDVKHSFATGPAWRSDFQAAEAESRRQQVPMLVHFYADWCGPCRRMDREVLSSQQLLREFSSGIVAVKLNSDRYPQLVRRFQVRALPCDVFIDPKGKVISRVEGYQPHHVYLRKVTSLKSSYAGRAVPSAPQRTEAETQVADPNPRSGTDLDLDELTPIDSVPVKRPDRLVGLDSFSPVALWNWRQWRRGKSEFQAEYQGVTYYLSDADELAEFKRSPRRYAPHLLGCDPVILAESDKAVAGSTQYGAYFDGGLYLFSTQRNRDRFKRAPFRYSRTQHAIRIDDIRRTSLN